MCNIKKIKLLTDLAIFNIKGEIYKFYKNGRKIESIFPKFLFLNSSDKAKTNEMRKIQKHSWLSYFLFSLLSLIIGTWINFR